MSRFGWLFERLRRVAGLLRQRWKLVAGLVLAVLLIVGGGFVWYFSTPLHAQDDQLATAKDREDVEISRAHGGYVIEPANATGEERVGLVFYPGGRVHPDAYVPSLARIAAEADVTVYVPQMRLNLAVLSRNRAAGVIDDHPEIDRWYVGGHSLGGAMACRYANSATDQVEGVVLFAAYCDRDVSGTDLDVLSVTGEADTVLDRDRYESTRENLPADATLASLAGVNHSQFGAYTGQRGGQPSGTAFDEAHRRLAAVVVPWFENATADRGGSTSDGALADPLGARPGAVDRARARDDITVTATDRGGYVVEPTAAPADGERVGVVFYPGGRVLPEAYVSSLASVAAEANVSVYVPKFRGNLPVANPDRAADVIEAHPEIDRWYVGGHSLGGAMACRYAANSTERVEGLVLFAAYCDRDVSETDLGVLSVTGAADAVLDRDRYEASRERLPPGATVVELDGVNHSQFGEYVGQRGGQPSGTTFDEAHRRLAAVVVPWLENDTARTATTSRTERPRTTAEGHASARRAAVDGRVAAAPLSRDRRARDSSVPLPF